MTGRARGRSAGAWLDLMLGRLQAGDTVRLPVLSGSMLPILVPGMMTEIEAASWRECRVGDIIVVRESASLTAHRLLFRLSLAGRIWLLQKGDVNRTGGWITPGQVAGVVVRAQVARGRYQDFRTPAARAEARRLAGRQLLRALAWTAFQAPAVRSIRRQLRWALGKTPASAGTKEQPPDEEPGGAP